MTDEDAVLTANLEFYRAFTEHDYQAMDRIWARNAPVTCIHPGWAPLGGREAVMDSWHTLLSNPDAPTVACHDEQVVFQGDVAVVLCEEALPASTLVATNLFVREEGGWRMVHHQAAPMLFPEMRHRRFPRAMKTPDRR